MEKKTIWQCHNPACNAQYSEYVNGCPKCSNGEPGGSYKVSILNEFHPAYGDGYPQTPEMDLILRIVSQWGNAVEMPNMEGWLKAYAAKATPQGIGWVKASERLPASTTPPELIIVKWDTIAGNHMLRYMTANQLADMVKASVLEYYWLDESAGEKEVEGEK